MKRDNQTSTQTFHKHTAKDCMNKTFKRTPKLSITLSSQLVEVSINQSSHVSDLNLMKKKSRAMFTETQAGWLKKWSQQRHHKSSLAPHASQVLIHHILVGASFLDSWIPNFIHLSQALVYACLSPLSCCTHGHLVWSARNDTTLLFQDVWISATR